jgi:uncharacterized protein (DUF1697 family)
MIYIALLRGINVSGSNLIRMESLKKSLDASGLSNVTTYIQSGNILFSHDILDKQYLEKHITDTINKDFGFLVPVHIRTLGELENVIKRIHLLLITLILSTHFMQHSFREYQIRILPHTFYPGWMMTMK